MATQKQIQGSVKTSGWGIYVPPTAPASKGLPKRVAQRDSQFLATLSQYTWILLRGSYKMNFVCRKQMTRVPIKLEVYCKRSRERLPVVPSEEFGEKMLRWKLNLFVTDCINGGGGKFSSCLAAHSPF